MDVEFQYNIDILVTGSKNQLRNYGSEFPQTFQQVLPVFIVSFAIFFNQKQHGLLKNSENLGFVNAC